MQTGTAWINGRAACTACPFVGWVIKHPEAEVVCPKCGATTRAASGDERQPRHIDEQGLIEAIETGRPVSG